MSAPTSLQPATGKQATMSNQQLRHSSFEPLGGNRSYRGSQSQNVASLQQQLNQAPELIEMKFNELAKKILEELAQAQYSRDFFHAVDEIIKEPASKSFAHNQSISQQFRYFNRQAAAATAAAAAAATAAANAAATAATVAVTNRNEQIAAAAVAAAAANSSNVTNQQQQPTPIVSLAPELATEQTRSLPADASRTPLNTINKQQQVSPRQQQLSPQRQRSAIPTSSVQNGFGQSQQRSSLGANLVEQQAFGAYPISRSATTGASLETSPQRGKQQQSRSPQLVGSITDDENLATKSRLSQQLLIQQSRQQQQKQSTENWPQFSRKQKAHKASNMFVSNLSRSVDGADDDDDDEDEDEDDDDNDDDDDLSPEIRLNRRNPYLNQRFSPITKSKTVSDTSNFSEINNPNQLHGNKQTSSSNSSVRQTQQYPQQQQQQQPKPRQTRQRFNPIVRSNTIGSGSQVGGQGQQKHLLEPKQTINGRDISHLYKPHMNYSTSVLGNHRLSDDDEIIIIPTQSPSQLSTSPDNCDGNGDELAERFSISRTKSFWEKLSKGSPGKRGGSAGSAGSSGGESQLLQQRQVSTIKSAMQSQAQQPQQQQLGGSGGHNKTSNSTNGTGSSKKSNGRMERMDSTGGSNSNYSSSGDEVGAPKTSPRSQQNPTISRLQQEMSRQNRFRQTR